MYRLHLILQRTKKYQSHAYARSANCYKLSFFLSVDFNNFAIYEYIKEKKMHNCMSKNHFVSVHNAIFLKFINLKLM